jgi:hypothetical protein
MNPPGRSAEPPAPNRAREGQWNTVQRALDEGKPKSAVEALVQEHKQYETDRAQWDYERTELLNRYVHTDVLL